MRFVIKKFGCGSERVGSLAGVNKFPGTSIETPTSALYTQGGSVVHLTTDVLSRVFSEPQLLWLPLSHTVHLETGVKAQGDGVAKFAGVSGHFTSCTLNNINENNPQGHFEMDRMPLWTKHGKKMINADRYMDFMQLFKPDIIMAIADNRISLDAPCKRIIKSLDRTSNMLETCVQRYKGSAQLQDSSLIGVIIGNNDIKNLEKSIEHVLKYKDDLEGVAVGGLTDGSEKSLKISTEKLIDIFTKINVALPKDKLRIIEGAWDPSIVVTAIQHGWDLFDGSYPIQLTDAGLALALKFDISQNNEELCVLNLEDARYKEDFSPILAGCECLACKKHTRAYVRHLLTTREMLAKVLLSIHNLYHFDQLFYYARRHIAENKYGSFKLLITNQYEMYMSSQQENSIENITNEDIDVDSVEKEVGKSKKRSRVSNRRHPIKQHSKNSKLQETLQAPPEKEYRQSSRSRPLKNM